jgi:hypothetical protein
MPSLRFCVSGVRPPLIALVPTVVAVAFAAGPATAGAAGASADLATTIGNVSVFSSVARFTVTVKNKGPSTARNVTVTDSWFGGGFWEFWGLQVTPPAGVSCTTPPLGKPLAPRVVTCSVSSLGPGESIMLGLTLRPLLFTGRGGVTDSATAASSTPDPNSANNTASFTATTV